MATHRIVIEETFNLPVSSVFNLFADHKRFGQLLRAPIQRIRDSEQDNPNGLGSVRLVGVAGIGLEETVTAFEPDHLIEYSVSNGGPIKNHLGRMIFEDLGGRTRFHYTITFEDAVPLIGYILRPALEMGLRQSMKRVERLASS